MFLESLDTTRKIQSALQVLTPIQMELKNQSHLHAGHEGAKQGGGHFALFIVSDKFNGKSTLMRHRSVFSALGTLMQHEIHALTIIALTPDEASRAKSE